MKPCNDCPFIVKTPLAGSPDWALDVLLRYKTQSLGFKHTCHKTDPVADGFVGGKAVRQCAGFARIKTNEAAGIQVFKDAYPTIMAMLNRYVEHWKQIGLVK